MRYGDRVLFSDLDWLLTLGDRVGVVGANGAGKSTLLKILAGVESLDDGKLQKQKGLRIGYLPQEGLTFSGRTLLEECVSVFDEAIAIEREIEDLSHKMAKLDPSGPEFQAVIERYEWCSSRYQMLDGYTKEAQTTNVLGGLSFLKEDWHRPCEEFSGGWQMRIALAKLLLAKPNLLLLDEPTNHLDLEARNWLEDYLRSYPYAYVLISHDRYFMDSTISKIVHLWNRQAHFYTGNYSKFEKLHKERLLQLRAAHRNQKDRIEQLEAFINRFRYQATKAKQVQSRVKELEKIERIEIPPEEKAIHFRFPQPQASGRVVIELDDVDKSYGSTRVLEKVGLRIEKGDRIALVGINGAGKSTLIRMLAGNEPLSAGVRKEGYQVGIDYFAQDQYKELNPDAVLFEDLSSHAPNMGTSELRGLLGSFLFSGDDAFKKIKVLSGGERNRYALARMLVRPQNFLLLDEPTNHLDLRAKDVLLDALLEFQGTMVFVSHDRYFIQQLANKVIAISDKQVEVYPGNYEEFVWSRQKRDEESVEPVVQVSSELTAALAFTTQQRETISKGNGSPRRLNPLKAEKIRVRIESIEKQIEILEKTCLRLQDEVTAAGSDYSLQQSAISDLESSQLKIQRYENEWTELSEQLSVSA